MLKNIGIFRALDVRFAHAEFAASFSGLEALFAANIDGALKKYIRSLRVSYKDIPLKPRLLFDPVYPLLKKTDFTPWQEFDHDIVNSVCKGLDLYEIYEPYFYYASQIANLAKKNDVPLVTEIWTSFSQHPSHIIPPYSFLVKNVVEKTDLFVFRSEKAQSFLNAYSIPKNKKSVIYQGVNVKRFFPAKKKDNERIRILFVGALDAHKGLDDILAVFPKLDDKYPKKLELIICGKGTLQKVVDKAALSLPITYKGFVSHLDLPDIYRSADIYCQPSKDYMFFGVKGGEEFAGYTFMEAMASGLPIIATYCGGIPEIVGNKNSLITQGNRNELYKSLDTFIASKSLRQETGLQNRHRAENEFDIYEQTKKLEKIIKDRLS